MAANRLIVAFIGEGLGGQEIQTFFGSFFQIDVAGNAEVVGGIQAGNCRKGLRRGSGLRRPRTCREFALADRV